MTKRAHANSIKFWADNASCKVWHYNPTNKLLTPINNPFWYFHKVYIITNCYAEEELLKAWVKGEKLEVSGMNSCSTYEDMKMGDIPEFYKYQYRLKVEKTPYGLAREEADAQKESGEPVDIYKWHWGTGQKFISSTAWEFCYSSPYSLEPYYFSKNDCFDLGYSTSKIYRKKR